MTGSLSEIAWIQGNIQHPAVGSLTPWISTSSYPYRLSGSSCVANAGYIYCIGGYSGSSYSNAVYYASINSSGIGTWQETTGYPFDVVTQSCVAYHGYVYCIGGRANNNDTSAVYYAPLNSSGVGTWSQTQSYPYSVQGESCVAYSGYVYCVGTVPNNISHFPVYYARIDSSGVSAWVRSTDFPVEIYFQSCVPTSGYIQCIGGEDLALGGYLSRIYARLSSSGVSNWSQATDYPLSVLLPSCTEYSSQIYCIGGIREPSGADTSLVYRATANASGVIAWGSTSAYPISIHDSNCVAYSDYIYCVGGYESATQSAVNASYYSEIMTPPLVAAFDSQSNPSNQVIYVLSVVVIVLACCLTILAILKIVRWNRSGRIPASIVRP